MSDHPYGLKFEWCEFEPHELEKITGLSTAMQRDWRARGFLPKAPGKKHARFTASDLARILVMKLAADRGHGPQQSVATGLADTGRDAALVWAFSHEEAFAAEWVTERSQLPDEWRRRRGDPRSLQRQWMWHELAKVLGYVSAPFGTPILAEKDFRIAIIQGVDRSVGAGNFNTFRAETLVEREMVSDPIMLLNVEKIGEHLIRQAGRPLVRVDRVPAGQADPPHPIVAKLTVLE